MHRQVPHALVLPHLNAFALSLFMRPKANRLLELGLGGGALRRFVKHYYGHLHLDSVELNQGVIDTYKMYFCPERNYEEHIVNRDARAYVGQALAVTDKYDVIFVDLFGHQGSPDFLWHRDFYQNCRQCLRPGGLLVINLLPLLSGQVDTLLTLLGESHQHPPSHFSVPGYKNRILIQGSEPLPRLALTPELLAFVDNNHLDLNQLIQLA